MSAGSLSPLPSTKLVFAERLRSVWQGSRAEIALAVLAGLMIVLIPLLDLAIRRLAVTPGRVAFPLATLGLIAPFVVWKQEEPSRRSYLLAMPVRHGRNELMKVASGWICLLAAGVFLFLTMLIVSRLTDGVVGVLEMSTFTGTDRSSATEADFYRVVVRTPFWQWLVPITAASITYLIISAVVVSAEHPFRWIGAFILIVGTLIAAQEQVPFLPGIPESFGWSRRLFGDFTTYGLQTALSGYLRTAEPIPGTAQTMLVTRPNFSAWVSATAIWLIPGTIGTTIALLRHRGR